MNKDNNSTKISTLTIVNNVNGGRVLAYRNKTSIEIFHTTEEVGFNDFSYSWKEVIAIGKKLEEMLEKDLADVT